LILGDEAAYDGREVIAAGKGESVDAHVGSAMMSEALGGVNLMSAMRLVGCTYDVSDGDLRQGFDGRDEEALDDAFGDPFTVA